MKFLGFLKSLNPGRKVQSKHTRHQGAKQRAKYAKLRETGTWHSKPEASQSTSGR